MRLNKEGLRELRNRIVEALIKLLSKTSEPSMGSSPKTLDDKREKEAVSSLN